MSGQETSNTHAAAQGAPGDEPSLVEGSASAAPPGLGATAAAGTTWTTVQVAINKVATIVSMWLVARLLSEEEIGIAALSISVGMFLCILPPLTVGDVIVTHTDRFAPIARAATRLANLVGIGSFVLTALAAPLAAWADGQSMTGVYVGLLLVVGLRPVSFGLAAVPLARLRVAYDYRSIALIDGSTQLGATTLTVVLAAIGCGPLAMVLPQVAVTFLRAWLYHSRDKQSARLASAATKEAEARCTSEERKTLVRQFAFAAIAQYVHNSLVMLPVVVLGYLSTKTETGIYAFIFSISAQANGLIASQLGTVLQPVFVGLGKGTERQLSGFLRVIRVLGAGAVPVCLLQSALATPIFLLLLEPKWLDAVAVFAVLSVLESSYFATAPTMAYLRAQGRFGAYFTWQICQFAVALVAFACVAREHGALGVAIACAALWMCALPIAVWICTKPSGGTLWGALRLFIDPWLTALPVAALVWWAAVALEPMGRLGAIIAVLGAGPVGLGVALWLTKFSQPTAYAELRALASRGVGRFVRRRR
jgi:O-antigen/teichoic acid export membrane protein